jgi:predicted deacylase
VAQEAVEWLKANPSVIPAGVSVSVIPQVNPDGLAKAGQRFNANNVDLNRNFDCDWTAEGTWQNKKVSGGTAVFSEPEAKSVQNFVEMYKPAAAIAFFSSEGAVYPSGCGEVLPASTTLVQTFAAASGYPANTSDFSHYKITGDMVNWMAKNGIPAISVLLTDHTSTEWAKNEKGLTAVLNALAK